MDTSQKIKELEYVVSQAKFHLFWTTFSETTRKELVKGFEEDIQQLNELKQELNTVSGRL